MPRVWKIAKALAVFGGLVFLIGAFFYGYVVSSARQLTREKIIPMIGSPELKLTAADLSPRQLEILLKVEDPSFFQHNGVDFSTPGQGLTTITQALVKILYFEKFKPGIAKISQTLIARFALNPMVSKNDQLKLLLNLAWLGSDEKGLGIIGFQAAARKFFSKELNQLTEDEFTAIVATFIAPSVFSPIKNPAMSVDRVNRIKKLVSGQYIPKGLCDQYYGVIPKEYQSQLAPASYFESYYE